MRNAKIFLCAAMFMAVIACATLTDSGTSSAAGEKKAGVASHWRHHDGHWSYWHDGDQRWYYTDGTDWFYNTGTGVTWNVYGFDKGFGKEGFERGEYKTPAAGTKVTSPNHGTYRVPRK